MARKNFTILPYIDDMCGIAKSKQEAIAGFEYLIQTLQALGLKEATHKRSPPARAVRWLGVEFDCVAGLLKIPQDKIEDTLALVKHWQGMRTVPLHKLRSLLGKLLHIAQCCHPARLFLNRMLPSLRHSAGRYIDIDDGFRRDLNWFADYLAVCNGVYIMDQSAHAQHTIYAAASKDGVTALLLTADCYYDTPLPLFVSASNLAAAHIGLLNCLVAIKLWASLLAGGVVLLHCDCLQTVNVLDTAASRDLALISLARELWLIAARHDIHVVAKFNSDCSLQLKRALGNNLSKCDVNEYLFKQQSNI